MNVNDLYAELGDLIKQGYGARLVMVGVGCCEVVVAEEATATEWGHSVETEDDYEWVETPVVRIR